MFEVRWSADWAHENEFDAPVVGDGMELLARLRPSLTTLEFGRALGEERLEARAEIVALEALFLGFGLARQRGLERVLGAESDRPRGPEPFAA